MKEHFDGEKPLSLGGPSSGSHTYWYTDPGRECGEGGSSRPDSQWNGSTARWHPNTSTAAALPSGSTLTIGR